MAADGHSNSAESAGDVLHKTHRVAGDVLKDVVGLLLEFRTFLQHFLSEFMASEDGDVIEGFKMSYSFELVQLLCFAEDLGVAEVEKLEVAGLHRDSSGKGEANSFNLFFKVKI